MKTHLLLSTLFCLSYLLIGCKEKVKTEATPVTELTDTSFAATPIDASEYYFAGEYRMNGDKALFMDCATGNTFSIAATPAASELNKKYMTRQLSPNETAFVECYGFLSPDKSGQAGTNDELVITRNVSLQSDTACTPDHNLIGDYITYIPNNVKPAERFVFSLHPDYTYTFNIYHLTANNARTATGKWYLLNKGYIQFTSNPLTNFTSEAFVNYNKMELTFKHSKRIYHKTERL